MLMGNSPRNSWPSSFSPKYTSVPAGILPQVQNEIEIKLKDIEKEIKDIGFQPKSTTHAIFNQCRLFDSVFRKKLNETEKTAEIREAFRGSYGLRENVRRLKLDTFFNGTYVKQICRQADGYQPHLVSPEKGLRLLIKEAMTYVVPPAQKCVDDVKFTLNATVLAAANDLTRHSFGQSNGALRPTSQQMLIDIAQRAIEEWSERALLVAIKLVHMEGDYITSNFFRRLADARARENERANMTQDNDSDLEMETPTQPEVEESLKGLNLLGGSARDYMMGYLEKNSDSHKSIPLDSWKWQKRWFVLSETKKKLYYFKDPDELPHYRGVVDMEHCVVEDLDMENSQSRDSNQPRNSTSSFSLMISLSSSDPKRPILKDHLRVILKADNASSKYEWLTRLQQSVPQSLNSSVTRRHTHTPNSGRGKQSAAKTSSMPEISPTKSVWGDVIDEDHKNKGKGSPFSAYFRQTLKGNGGKDGQFYDILGSDLSQYTNMVLESLCRSVPKAVVHCQVKRAESEMLEQLYADVNDLSNEQLESMIFEDSDVTQRRAALLNAKEDLQAAHEITRGLISSVSGLLDETEKVEAPIYILELADMLDLVQEKNLQEPTIAVGPYTPKALRPRSEFPQKMEEQRAKSISAPKAPSPTKLKPRQPRRKPPPPPPKAR